MSENQNIHLTQITNFLEIIRQWSKSKMTLLSTKTHLMQLLADSENKVIALSGKWGTGKELSLAEIKNSSIDIAVQNALYVSLFGLADMNQLRLKIIQSAIPNAEVHPAAWETVSVAFNAIKGFMVFNKGFSALDELAFLAVPSILKSVLLSLMTLSVNTRN